MSNGFSSVWISACYPSSVVLPVTSCSWLTGHQMRGTFRDLCPGIGAIAALQGHPVQVGVRWMRLRSPGFRCTKKTSDASSPCSSAPLMLVLLQFLRKRMAMQTSVQGPTERADCPGFTQLNAMLLIGQKYRNSV